MTATVARGAGRASATQRRNRHAQTTPLPPKGSIETPVNDSTHPRYGTMTLPELRKVALEAGIPGAMRLTKGKALNALLEHERQSQEIATHGKRTTVPPKARQKPVKKAPSVAAKATDGASRSEPKATDFEAAATNLGWSTKREAREGDVIVVVASRGDESIGIEWAAGVFQPPCVYNYGGRAIQLRNASAAKQRMAMKPEEAAEETDRVVTRKVNATVRSTAPRRRKMELQLDALLDDDLIEALQGKTITWVNAISKEEESARVPLRSETRKPTNKTRINEGPRGREIWFVTSAGFRHVLVNAIVAVR